MAATTNFRIGVWKERAKKKREKLATLTTKRIREDNRYLKALQTLIKYGMQNDMLTFWFTSIHGEDWYCREDRLISISYTGTPKSQFYTALHEYGHFLSEKSGTRCMYQMPVKILPIKSLVGRCQVIGEEFEAWHHGRRLCIDLGLIHPVDDNDDFEKIKCRYLNTYLKWSVNLSKGSKNHE